MDMNGITKNAHAKINLTLDVVGKRPDGYHEVEMVMQTIELHDTVTVTRRKDGGVRMTITFEDGYRASDELLGAEADNLCVRAANLLRDGAGIAHGYDIALVKRIPVGAGLAGGSTDAAAVLHGVNELEDLGLSLEELCERGATLGADIPYCCMGGTRLASGTGTTLKRLRDCPALPLVLLKPEVSMPTGRIYQAYDGEEKPFHPDTERMTAALAEGSLKKVALALGNSLESVVTADFPIVSTLKDALLTAGAINAIMTGSGSCVYGVFADGETAMVAAEGLKKAYPKTFVCQSLTCCP